MQEETPPSELFGYFKELLVEYPRHSKSRHCVGDLSCSLADFGFIIQRNYLKTSHAKGEQDAAGSHVKQKVSQAVLNRLATINSAKAMHKFLTEKFTQPAASSFTASSNSVQLKRRVSFYVPGKGEGAVIRNRPGRKFKEVKGIRKLHCIKSGSEQEKVLARQRSCYCISWIPDDEENYSNKAWLDDWKEVLVSRDGSVATTRQTTQEFGLDQGTASHIADLAVKGSTVAIAADDDPMYDFYLLKTHIGGDGGVRWELHRWLWIHCTERDTSVKRTLLFARQHPWYDIHSRWEPNCSCLCFHREADMRWYPMQKKGAKIYLQVAFEGKWGVNCFFVNNKTIFAASAWFL